VSTGDKPEIFKVRPDFRIASDLPDHVLFPNTCKRQRHHEFLPRLSISIG